MAPWLVHDFYEENVKSLATYLVKSVFDMAMKEAGSWLISTVRRQGFEGLRPLLEEGKDLFDAMTENPGLLSRFKVYRLHKVYEDDDPWH